METQNVEKGHLAPSNLTFFINCDRQKRFLQNEKRRADLQNLASDFFMIFQSFVTILPRFFDFGNHNYVPRQKLKNLRQRFVAMNMMNKCAKFHNSSPSDKKKLNSISRARLNFQRRPVCVQLCIETICKRATSVAHLTNFSFDFFLWNFHRRCLSTSSIPWCKKVKNDQKLKSRGGGGSCLINTKNCCLLQTDVQLTN